MNQATPLIQPEALAGALGEPDLRILDIRSAVDGGGRAAFEGGHVPRAVHTDYVADGWRMSRDGAAGLLPEPDMLARLFGRLGLRPGDRAVVVPAGVSHGDFSAAARIYWTLRMAGHERLAILDGGFARWAGEGRPVETGPGSTPAPTSYPVALEAGGRALLAEVAEAVSGTPGDGRAMLLDNRGPKSFVGAEKSPQAARAGRLPGAAHLDASLAYDPAANRIRPLPELETLFGSVPGGPVITYCNTGQLASTGWFVMSELLGRPGVAMYDGSMSQWTQDSDRPVETGPPA